MVKSDAHMERIRMKLLDERAGIKKTEDKRKEREAKKFGKKVQIEKQKERERSKKDMADRLKSLKRSTSLFLRATQVCTSHCFPSTERKGALENAEADGEDFDVAVEEAIADRPAAKRARGEGGGKMPRNARDAKFGYGGKGKRSKQNTRSSTDSFAAGPSKKGKGKGGVSQRPGKSRRQAMKSRR